MDYQAYRQLSNLGGDWDAGVGVHIFFFTLPLLNITIWTERGGMSLFNIFKNHVFINSDVLDIFFF